MFPTLGTQGKPKDPWGLWVQPEKKEHRHRWIHFRPTPIWLGFQPSASLGLSPKFSDPRLGRRTVLAKASRYLGSSKASRSYRKRHFQVVLGAVVLGLSGFWWLF